MPAGGAAGGAILAATALSATASAGAPTALAVFSLWFFGALCAAAGIGGGGVIVTILMIGGGLTPHDAVPVSKAVVFLGAMVSLALNVGRKKDPMTAPLVDWLLLKMVVPMALLGTLLGVLTNERTPGWGVLIFLAATLVPTFFLLLRRAQQQLLEEKILDNLGHPDETVGLLEGASHKSGGPSGLQLPPDSKKEQSTSPCKEQSTSTLPCKEKPAGPQHMMTYRDGLLLGLMLIIVITGGVLQHHVRACFNDQQRINSTPGFRLRSMSGVLSCRHPVLNLAFRGQAEAWMAKQGFASAALTFLLALPIWACFGTALFYAHQALQSGWTRWRTATHLAVGFIAGMLAGLVGIGGGLIFSPFFLLTGIDPAVAVATSSTTVVFTSSSTTIQYFLMDRIQMTPAVTYGIVNAFASLCGTRFVQFIGDRCKKSYITLIVALSVALSIALSSMKCAELIKKALNGVIVP